MSTLDQMQAFVTVVEEGSFTAAGMQFAISTTAMCKKIAKLEESLNTSLIIRTPRLIKTTDIGQKYYIQCKKILHEYQLSNLIISNQDNSITGTLNIVCIREVAQTIVYPLMRKFLESYPEIMTNVTVKKHYQEINLNKIDVALGYVPNKFFNEWCMVKLENISLYYLNVKPIQRKIEVYINYLRHQLTNNL